ncbi:MAG: hypothetical protein A3K19_13920 [Lentisphaerae bacterium RIFOXYB12_FULL_65_16]|nr:MAG: hypothetical protein A3K18_25920 [Lentisphaerae bacterium RIFOXYA12_64_32]OGV88213.1 MAG: hypothetical protein A3K19_13920 [Lentisphaerae bacterium RIFOXYB12_FULL_65_16]
MRLRNRVGRVTAGGLAVSALASVILSGCVRGPQSPATTAAPVPAPAEAAVQQQVQEVAVKAGKSVFSTGFETDAERTVWSAAPGVTWAQPGHESGTCLAVNAPESAQKGALMVEMPFDLAPYRGMRLRFECMARAENASKPPQRWNGVKFMLHYKSAAYGPHWSNQNDVFGTFDWKRLAFSAPITSDADGGVLCLGVQESWGKVWFDNIKVTVYRVPPPARPAPMANPPSAYKGHNLPRLRGVMSPNQFRDEDLRVLGMDWKANLIRWQLTRNWGAKNTDRDLAEYDRWLDGKLADLDKALEACQRYGIKVVVDLHSPPGGRYENSDMAMFYEAVYQEHFVKVWERMATRYRGNPAVWGYDLVNEPVQSEPSPAGLGDYLGAQVRAARAIRAIDPVTPIIIESDQWDSASAYADLVPVDVPNVVYQVHMYYPGTFTHQGVYGSVTGVTYPGQVDGKPLDKAALRRHLQPVRDFQLAYNVHIYVGEFSAIRWAPGDSAFQYLRDCIDIFEEYGWDWSYHAYREWDGWSVEHGPDRDDHKPTATPGDRMQLLLGWFGKNAKP